MASLLREEENEPISQINIVPFVDIILVVLIVFMATAPMIARQGIPLRLPKAKVGTPSDRPSFLVEINSKGHVFIEGRRVPDGEIKSRAQKAFDAHSMVQAVISADKAVSHGRVVRVIGWIKAGGIHQFSITVEKEK